MTTTIEWTDETWNPVVGCSETSPGCDNCYAARVAHRAMQPAHEGLTIYDDNGVRWNGTIRCLPERLNEPLSWVKPRRVFVNSMSDLFHPDVPQHFISDVFDVMACHGPIARHTFQVLTKRSRRMETILNCWAENEGYVGAPNVWLGVSIENARYAFRADHLRATPAAVRFLSAGRDGCRSGRASVRWKCDDCGLFFTSGAGLGGHRKVHRNATPPAPAAEPDSDVTPIRGRECVEPGCTTRLSAYNKNDKCSVHDSLIVPPKFARAAADA